MRKIKAINIEISSIAHATEDPEKVLIAILNILPEDLRGFIRERIEYTDTYGHYKDPIRIYRIKIENNDAEKILSYILNRLSSSEKEILLLSLEDRYDPSTRKLFIRLSKQDAYKGEVSIGFDDDIIRIAVGISGAKNIKDLENYLRSLIKK